MERYVITLLVAAYCLVGTCFSILLGHFLVVLTWFHAHPGSELGVYGTCHKSRQLVCVQMRSQRVIVPNKISRYMFV